MNDSMKPEFSEGKINITGASNTAFRNFRANRENIVGGGLGGRKQHKAAMAFLQQHHQNVMEHLSASYGHETAFQSHMAGLAETAAASEHSRTEAMQKAINKAAEGGTGVSFAKGDFSAQYTKAKPKERKPKTAAPQTFAPVKVAEEPQMEAPASSTPSAKPKKIAYNTPGTGKIAYRVEGEKPPAATKVKKAAPRKRK